MGLYLNPGYDGFEEIRRDIYVDKTGLIVFTNSLLANQSCWFVLAGQEDLARRLMPICSAHITTEPAIPTPFSRIWKWAALTILPRI